MGGREEEDDDGLDPSDEALLREAAHAPARAPAALGAQLVGRRIGKYEIVEVLGRGGMGIVYVARDTALERRVALKVMSRQELGNEERRRRFLREAKSAAAVTGPNIAAIYDVGVEDGLAAGAPRSSRRKTARVTSASRPRRRRAR